MMTEQYTSLFYRIGEATEDAHRVALLCDIVEKLVQEVSTLEKRVDELSKDNPKVDELLEKLAGKQQREPEEPEWDDTDAISPDGRDSDLWVKKPNN